MVLGVKFEVIAERCLLKCIAKVRLLVVRGAALHTSLVGLSPDHHSSRRVRATLLNTSKLRGVLTFKITLIW